MSPIYEYRCTTCIQITESRQGYDDTSIPCPLCGAVAHRNPVQRFHVGGGPTTKFRLTEYQEASEEARYYHGKMENDRGTKLPRIPVVQMAAAKARQQGAKVNLPKEVA